MTEFPSHPSARTRKRQQRRRRSGGFTLIEAALTGVIVGTGVLAMVSAQQAYHIKNGWALRTGTGQLLANEMRELMISLRPYDPAQPDHVGAESNEGTLGSGPADPLNVASWDDVDDFAGTGSLTNWTGVTFMPPLNGLAQPIDGLDQWSQDVRVQSVLPDDLDEDVSDPNRAQPLGTTDIYRVTCSVFYQRDPDDPASPRQLISTLQWVVPK